MIGGGDSVFLGQIFNWSHILASLLNPYFCQGYQVIPLVAVLSAHILEFGFPLNFFCEHSFICLTLYKFVERTLHPLCPPLTYTFLIFLRRSLEENGEKYTLIFLIKSFVHVFLKGCSVICTCYHGSCFHLSI